MPLISVITSTHNRAKNFLPHCIDSVKAQTFDNYEHIIVDDCSTDATKKLVAEYASHDRRIKYVKTPFNFGSDPGPKNIGLLKARGEFVIFLDDDNTLRPKAVEQLYKLIIKGPYDVVYGDMWIASSNAAGIAMDFDLQRLSLQNYIDTSAALIDRQVLLDIGGWDETLPKFVDWNLFVRLAKSGARFKRLPQFTFDYNIHLENKSHRVKAQTYNHPDLGQLFVPTFDPVDCKIKIQNFEPYRAPRVAIFTIHYDRKEYSELTYQEMKQTAGYDFDWFCADNGTDGTYEMFSGKTKFSVRYPENVGLTRASNKLIDVIKRGEYDIIIKIDNDVEFITHDWLKDIVSLWESNHLIYISPYVEGLVDNPGGALRIGRAIINGELIEVTKHIGGIFAAIDAKAYNDFRWKDKLYHGYQDLEASTAFLKMGYMPCYLPKHVIKHRDSTAGQKKKYKDYFERRKVEKVTNAPRVEVVEQAKNGFGRKL